VKEHNKTFKFVPALRASTEPKRLRPFGPLNSDVMFTSAGKSIVRECQPIQLRDVMKATISFKPILFTVSFGSLALLFSASVYSCERGQDANYADFIEVLSSSFEAKTLEQGGMVTSIGILKNTYSSDLESMVIEVRYFDDDAQLLDVASEQMYGMVAPAGEEIAFRVQSYSASSQDAYTSHEVKVTWADLKHGCRSSTSNSRGLLGTVGQVLIAISPIALLIFVWLWIIRRYGRTKSKKTQIQLIEEQVENSKKLTAEVQRIADHLSAESQTSSDKKLERGD
jgi:hypothetical protein